MNLKQIETVIQIARLGSLSKAATSLGMAQSILSRNLNALEADWGQRLFDRRGRGLELSEFGRLMLPECEALLQQQHRIEQLVRESEGRVNGTVTLGVAPSVAHAVIPSFVWSLKQALPEVVLCIHEGVSGQLDDWLISGKVDLAIANRHNRNASAEEDLLMEVEMFLVTGSARIRPENTVNFHALDKLPLVLPAAPCEFRDALGQAAKDCGITLNVVFESESIPTIKDLVRLGRASTILPMSSIKPDVEAGSLFASKVVSPSMTRRITLCANREHQLSPAARLVMRHIVEQMPGLVQRSS